jgi:hypothetical protein
MVNYFAYGYRHSRMRAGADRSDEFAGTGGSTS